MSRTLQQAHAAWRAVLERLGLAGALGVAALLLALLLAGTLGRSLWQQRQALQTLQQALDDGAALPARPLQDGSAAGQLSRFHAGFPPATDSAESLRKLHAAARRAGLQLLSGEYRLESRPGDALQRYAVVLPVQGSYAQLRQFMDAVLAEVPHAALEDVELRRDSASSPVLEARVRLTLFLRGER